MQLPALQRGSEGSASWRRLRSLASVGADNGGSDDRFLGGDRLLDRRGQMLLIVILIMVVALTIGLSVASRTITNLQISRENEESQRAFQAAEAGLDIAIKYVEKRREGITIAQGTTQLDNNSRYSFSDEEIGANDELNGDNPVEQDRGIDVWLMDYENFINSTPGTGCNGNVVLRWESDGNNSCGPGSGRTSAPALEVWRLSGPINSPNIEKRVYDVCPGRTPGSSPPPGSAPGYLYRTDPFAFTDGILMKAIPLYNSTKMYIVGSCSNIDFPIQGSIITSTGSSGNTVRKLEYFESNPELPTEMFYSILSQ